VSGQLHAPAALTPGKGPVWTRWWREKLPASSGTLNLPPSQQ